MAEPIPLWLDCDTGHDDAFAILLASHAPGARLVGVSTTHGNAPVHHTTRNTRAVLHAIACPDTLLVRGADKPLKRPPSFAPSIHGESGLDGVEALPKLPLGADEVDGPQPESLEARIDRIADAILAEQPGKLWVVATGPLTNVAHLLRRRPQVAAHIAGLSLMGGAVGGGFTDAPLGVPSSEANAEPRFGNVTPYAEFNIWADPDAARLVFSHPQLNGEADGVGKLIMLGLDITHLCRGVPAVQDKILHSAKTASPGRQEVEMRIMFRQVMTFFAATYSTEFGISDGPPVHDPLAVWAVLAPDRFRGITGKRYAVDVIVEEDEDANKRPAGRSSHVGQTVVTLKQNGQGGVQIPTDLDVALFWDTIDDCLTSAGQKHAKLNSDPWPQQKGQEDK